MQYFSNQNIKFAITWYPCPPPKYATSLKFLKIKLKTLSPNKCHGYDTKQSDGEVPVMLELWGMQSTPSLTLLPGPLWPGVVASE